MCLLLLYVGECFFPVLHYGSPIMVQSIGERVVSNAWQLRGGDSRCARGRYGYGDFHVVCVHAIGYFASRQLGLRKQKPTGEMVDICGC